MITYQNAKAAEEALAALENALRVVQRAGQVLQRTTPDLNPLTADDITTLKALYRRTTAAQAQLDQTELGTEPPSSP